MKKDYAVIRMLAEKVMEVAHDPVQDRRRRLWADHNSLRTREVPVYLLDPHCIWGEVSPELECEDPFLLGYENWLRLELYHASFGDDFITEKYLTMPPVMDRTDPYWRSWGIPEDSFTFTGKSYHRTEYERTMEDIESLYCPQRT